MNYSIILMLTYVIAVLINLSIWRKIQSQRGSVENGASQSDFALSTEILAALSWLISVIVGIILGVSLLKLSSIGVMWEEISVVGVIALSFPLGIERITRIPNDAAFLPIIYIFLLTPLITGILYLIGVQND